MVAGREKVPIILTLPGDHRASSVTSSRSGIDKNVVEIDEGLTTIGPLIGGEEDLLVRNNVTKDGHGEALGSNSVQGQDANGGGSKSGVRLGATKVD